MGERGGREGGRSGERGRAPSGGGAPGRRKGEGKGELWEWGKTLVLTVVFLVVIRMFFVQTFVITSGSMEETLLVGDFLMVNRLALGTRIPGLAMQTPGYSEPERGEVLVFDSVEDDGLTIVKRLIGMPGDTLQMRDKQLFINGVSQNEPYVEWRDPMGDDRDADMGWQVSHLVSSIDPSAYEPTRDTWGPLVVPEDQFFMMGDNRDFSRDSRYWGPVPRWRIEGKAMFFYYSYDRDSRAPFAFVREVRWDRIGTRIE